MKLKRILFGSVGYASLSLLLVGSSYASPGASSMKGSTVRERQSTGALLAKSESVRTRSQTVAPSPGDQTTADSVIARTADSSSRGWLHSLAVLETLYRVPGSKPAVLSNGDTVKPLSLHELDYSEIGSDLRSLAAIEEGLSAVVQADPAVGARIKQLRKRIRNWNR